MITGEDYTMIKFNAIFFADLFADVRNRFVGNYSCLLGSTLQKQHLRHVDKPGREELIQVQQEQNEGAKGSRVSSGAKKNLIPNHVDMQKRFSYIGHIKGEY